MRLIWILLNTVGCIRLLLNTFRSSPLIFSTRQEIAHICYIHVNGIRLYIVRMRFGGNDTTQFAKIVYRSIVRKVFSLCVAFFLFALFSSIYLKWLLICCCCCCFCFIHTFSHAFTVSFLHSLLSVWFSASACFTNSFSTTLESHWMSAEERVRRNE